MLFPVVKYNGIDHRLEGTTTKGFGTSEGIIADPGVDYTALRPPRKQRKASQLHTRLFGSRKYGITDLASCYFLPVMKMKACYKLYSLGLESILSTDSDERK